MLGKSDVRNLKSSFSKLTRQESLENLSPSCLEELYDHGMDINKEIAAWVRHARKSAGLSGEELGAKLAIELRTTRGHTKGNISHWELGKHQPSIQQLIAISKITGVPLPEGLVAANNDRLLENTERSLGGAADVTRVHGRLPIEFVEDGNAPDEAIEIKRVKLKLSAGISGFAVEPELDLDNPIYFRKSWLERNGYRKEDLMALRVRGNSMEPGLYDNDTVIINIAENKPQDGAVFAVNYEGEDVIKRLVRDIGLWWLISDNPDRARYPRKQCISDSCILIGKVIYKQSRHI